MAVIMDTPKDNETPETAGSVVRPMKASLSKSLPTDRVSFEKQTQVLRAYAAASGAEKKAVTNDEVSSVLAGLAASSISLCNPFFSEVGLLVQDGRKQRPTEPVFDYFHAYEWNPEIAGTKLYRVFQESWAAKALLPKLAFRSLSKEEAISFLAEESKATKAHRKHLELILDFLNISGVLRLDGSSVLKPASVSAPQNLEDSGKGDQVPPAVPPKPLKDDAPEDAVDKDVHRFVLPIPGKPSVVVLIPKSLDSDDWDMFSQMFGIYVNRWKGFHSSPAQLKREEEK